MLKIDVELRLRGAETRSDIARACEQLASAFRGEVARVARGNAPVVSGEYRSGIHETSEGVVGRVQHSADVERRHRTITGAADEVASRLAALVRPL